MLASVRICENFFKHFRNTLPYIIATCAHIQLYTKLYVFTVITLYIPDCTFAYNSHAVLKMRGKHRSDTIALSYYIFTNCSYTLAIDTR